MIERMRGERGERGKREEREREREERHTGGRKTERKEGDTERER